MSSLIIFWNEPSFDLSSYKNDNNEFKGISKIINVVDIITKNQVNSKSRTYINKEDLFELKLSGYAPISIKQKLKSYESNIFSVINRNFRVSGKKTNFSSITEYYDKILYFIYLLALKENVQSCLFFDTPHHPFDYIAFLYFKVNGGRNFVTREIPSNHTGSLSARRYVTCDFPYLDDNFNKIYDYYRLNQPTESDLPKDLKSFLEEYKDISSIVYNPQHLGTRWSPAYIIKYLFGKLIKYTIRFKFKTIYYKSKQYIYRLTIDQFRRNIILNYYSNNSIEPNLEEKYIYFPLHYQPEASTTPLGNEFANQELAIDYLIANTPDDVYLFIREHPGYWYKISNNDRIHYSRSIDFYDRLKKNSRIRLIDKNFNHLMLIKHSLAVATITGTVAFEAFGLSRTVFIFGEYIYSKMANTIIVPSEKGISSLNNLKNLTTDYSLEFKSTLFALNEITTKIESSNLKFKELINIKKNEFDFIRNYINSFLNT